MCADDDAPAAKVVVGGYGVGFGVERARIGADSSLRVVSVVGGVLYRV